jgi:AbrB family looped-hinge helix DNA binding protein
MLTKVKRSKKTVVEPVYKAAHLTISSKRQITIPSRMAKELGLQPGGMLVARLEDGTIVLNPRPKSLVEYLDSFPEAVYGRTKEEVDAYIREVREGWEERAKIAEGDAYIVENTD